MASIRTPQEILELAKYCQPLAANDVAGNILFKGDGLDRTLAMKIYMERKGIQWIYDKDPNNAALRNYSNYLFRFLDKYVVFADQIINNQQQVPPTVSGPENQTLNISGTASFTITPVSLLPYTIAWYKNGVLVPGETGVTYSYPVTVANNGDQVFAVVTNDAGSVTSQTATLTVGNSYTAYLHIGDNDEYPNISSGVDNLDYQFTTTMAVSSATFSFSLTPEAANNRWQVIKWPTAWGNVTEFFSTPLNSGFVPGVEYYAIVTIGSFSYICSRNALSFESAFPLVFKRP